MDEVVARLLEMNPLWIYLAVFSISFVENLFPPFPSDLVIVLAGSMIAVGSVSFLPTLLLAATGSTFGFITMYLIGFWSGGAILASGRWRFLPRRQLKWISIWFNRYGYWVIVANRFMAGTRAAVSFFAGLSKISLPLTATLSFISALLWSAILIYAGRLLGDNWHLVSPHLRRYGTLMTIFVISLFAYLLARSYFIRWRRRGSRAK